jgi:hypothetical protein
MCVTALLLRGWSGDDKTSLTAAVRRPPPENAPDGAMITVGAVRRRSQASESDSSSGGVGVLLSRSKCGDGAGTGAGKG